MKEHDDTLLALYQVIVERKENPTDSSYTASLMTAGIDRILKKLGEEATELVIAGKGGVREEVIYETADLFYHALVLLAYQDIPLNQIYAELQRRFSLSGLEEKQTRGVRD